MAHENVMMIAADNQSEIEAINRYFEGKIRFQASDFKLHEIRSDSLEEIAVSKVKQVYEKTQKHTIAIVSGLYIKSLNGFPGIHVNYAFNTIGINGFLKLMDGVNNRDCYLRQCLAYQSGDDFPKIFTSQYNGTFSDKIRETKKKDDWEELINIFIPVGCEKTLAEMSEEEQINSLYSQRDNVSALEEFGKWYIDFMASERRYQEMLWEHQWKTVCDFIVSNKLLPTISYETWIKPLRIKECVGDCVYIDNQQSDLKRQETIWYVKSKYGNMILELYNLCSGVEYKRIEFI